MRDLCARSHHNIYTTLSQAMSCGELFIIFRWRLILFLQRNSIKRDNERHDISLSDDETFRYS